MNRDQTTDKQDPLGLRDLPLLEPDRDGWAGIRAALEADAAPVARSTQPSRLRWMALAASLVIVAGIVFLVPRFGPSPDVDHDRVADRGPSAQAVPPGVDGVATNDTQDAGSGADAEAAGLQELIAMSQVLERRLRTLRDNTAAMPAESAVYVAELEDLVARVDSQLSFEPDSVDLWGQRVNLMLDLEILFQHHFEREYGRMASL